MPDSSEDIRISVAELERRSEELRKQAADMSKQIEQLKAEIAKRDAKKAGGNPT